MAKTLYRSKSLRFKKRRDQTQQETDISSPCLVATDAAPRHDLYDIKTAALTMHPITPSDAAGCEQRPQTAGGDSARSKLLRSVTSPVAHKSKDTTFEHPSLSSKTIICSAKVQGRTIGMALSKTEQTAPWDQENISDWKPPNGSTCTLVTSISSGSNTTGAQQDDQKPKISRWKSMFGRKPSRTPQQSSPYKPQAVKQIRKRSTTTPAESRPVVSASKADPISSSKPQEDLKFCGANSSPVGLGVPSVTVSSEPEPNLDDRRPAGRMLDIEIPNIQMERYSVMFGTVLQPAHPPVPQSLLVRRQGNTDRLKPLNELKVKPANELLPPQRRASSPSLARSPSFSFFSAVDSRALPAPRPKPLQRSQTAPGALSPNRAASDNSDLAVAEEKQDSQSTSSEILVPTPTTTGTIDIYADYCLTPLSISVGASLDYHCSSEDFRGETDLRPPQLLISKPPPSPASPASPTAQVSIARKMSVTRPRADSLRPMPIIRVGSGRVAGRKPRTPTLVEPLKRISQRVEVESV